MRMVKCWAHVHTFNSINENCKLKLSGLINQSYIVGFDIAIFDDVYENLFCYQKP